MRGLLTAVGFLTIVPLGARRKLEPGDLGRAAVWFPLVGLLIGLALAGVDWGCRALWDPYVAAALMLAVTLVLTGGLHLDGLMDTADALFSHRDRETMLAIMRDSRTGALGAAAAMSALLVKFAAYGHLSGADHWRVIAAAPLVGRLGIVLAMSVFPYAREAGTGAQFAKETRLRHAAAAAVGGALMLYLLLGPRGLMAAGVGLGFGGLAAVYAWRRLGGLTGDVYGATNEAVELAVLLAAALPMGG
jgi:adenosylcobinamide-GDP ribazoletransferase